MSLGPELYDPAAGPLRYTLDLSDWLGEDTLASASWSIEPEGPTISGSEKTETASTVTVAADGWALGTVYRLHCDFTSAASGERDRRTIVLRCGHK